jgi:c-di-GMP-binding flagellar brake protein YcgR
MPAPHTHANRKLTRYSLDKRVRVTVNGEPGAPVLHGRTCDISEGGLCALVSGKLKQGSIVFLEVSGLEEGSLSLTATVRHARGFYYGFEFVQMDQKQMNMLLKMITRNAVPRVHSRNESPAQ